MPAILAGKASNLRRHLELLLDGRGSSCRLGICAAPLLRRTVSKWPFECAAVCRRISSHVEFPTALAGFKDATE